MKNEAITIGSAVLGGALSRGLVSVAVKDEATPMTKGIVNGVLCIGAAFGAMKVSGNDTKANVLRGAALGVSIAQGLDMLKNIFSSEKLSAKVASNKFLSRSLGLSAPATIGLGGYIDAEGNYREEGLNGYIDAYGNYVEEGLSGYYDEDGNYIENGLAGYIDEDGNYVEGLGYSDEDEDGLNGYAEIDEYGNVLI